MRALWWTVLAATRCGAAPATSAAPTVVVLPGPEDEVHVAAATCPPDTLSERGGMCVRVLPSPEIPAWQAPAGHLDPCATWTSERGLVGCDPANEDARDAGPR